MRVGWISSRDYDEFGGAEQADLMMMQQAPPDVKIEVIHPLILDDWDIREFDATVCTGLRFFKQQQLGRIATARPVMWTHDMEFSGHWIYALSRKFLALTPQHLTIELRNQPGIKECEINPGWFDTSEISDSCRKREVAVWASRPHAHKGLDNAYAWAAEHQIPLRVFADKPRRVVLKEMCEAKYFVLLPHIFDAGPWSVIEAQLSGCEIVVNDKVGHFQVPREDLKDIIDRSGEAFWNVVFDT